MRGTLLQDFIPILVFKHFVELNNGFEIGGNGFADAQRDLVVTISTDIGGLGRKVTIDAVHHGPTVALFDLHIMV